MILIFYCCWCTSYGNNSTCLFPLVEGLPDSSNKYYAQFLMDYCNLAQRLSVKFLLLKSSMLVLASFKIFRRCKSCYHFFRIVLG